MSTQTTTAARPATASESRLRFSKLDAPFGIEVSGIDWDDPAPDEVRLITQALRRHLLLVFRGQKSPSHDQLDRFFERFGRLTLKTFDGAFHYTTFSRDDKVEIHRRDDGNYLTNTDAGLSELVWHNDHFHRPHLKLLSVIEAMDFEEGASSTCFRDMYTVYEMLPAEVRSRLEYKQTANFDPRQPGPQDKPRLCDAMHLVFPPHPHSGRKTLFVNDFTYRIVGVPDDENEKLLAQLRAFSLENAPFYEHEWRTGDMVVWDNVGLQHRRDGMPPGKRRVMRAYEAIAE
jgi:alpha-ketoglutarate-dependent taurine dioxygenase